MTLGPPHRFCKILISRLICGHNSQSPLPARRASGREESSALVLTDLLLFDGLEDFDDAFLIIDDVDALKDLAVFASPHFPDHLVIVLIPAQRHAVSALLVSSGDASRATGRNSISLPPLYRERLVVPVVLSIVDVDVGVNSRSAHHGVFLS